LEWLKRDIRLEAWILLSVVQGWILMDGCFDVAPDEFLLQYFKEPSVKAR
jgi:hypothetical protein